MASFGYFYDVFRYSFFIKYPVEATQSLLNDSEPINSTYIDVYVIEALKSLRVPNFFCECKSKVM